MQARRERGYFSDRFSANSRNTASRTPCLCQKAISLRVHSIIPTMPAEVLPATRSEKSPEAIVTMPAAQRTRLDRKRGVSMCRNGDWSMLLSDAYTLAWDLTLWRYFSSSAPEKFSQASARNTPHARHDRTQAADAV